VRSPCPSATLETAVFRPNNDLQRGSHHACSDWHDFHAKPDRNYLQKLFSARGTTCSHFIHSLRLDRASRLLQRRALSGGETPLGEIAFACGFLDYAHFSRKFRQRFGHPPSAHSAIVVRKSTSNAALPD
jgi:AraC-like DNA-binding protein